MNELTTATSWREDPRHLQNASMIADKADGVTKGLEAVGGKMDDYEKKWLDAVAKGDQKNAAIYQYKLQKFTQLFQSVQEFVHSRFQTMMGMIRKFNVNG